jgi:hypothetical protein
LLEVGIGVEGDIVEDRLLEGQHEEADPNPDCVSVLRPKNSEKALSRLTKHK